MGGRRGLRLAVFAAVVILGITAGVAHQKAISRARADFFTEWGLLLSKPFTSAAGVLSHRIASFAGVFRTNSSLKRQNAELKRQTLAERQALVQFRECQSESRRLAALLDAKQALGYRTVAARVITRPATPWAETCTLDVGSEDGIGPASAVLAAGGLVGQVFTTSGRTCQVLLLNDRNSSVPVLVQGSRAPGVCTGQGGPDLIMEYIPLDASVKKGDAVVSSGEGVVFPKGILVGHITSVETGKHTHFRRATVSPAVSFRSVEEVLVVVGHRS